jgi:hypothetical protein
MNIVKQTGRGGRIMGSRLRVIIEIHRGTIELVQHFAYRFSSHRRKGAARHEIEIV